MKITALVFVLGIVAYSQYFMNCIAEENKPIAGGENVEMSNCNNLPSESVTKKEKVIEMYCNYKKKFPEVEDISPREALELWQQEKAVFIDVRTPKEQAVSMIQGAITVEEYKANKDKYSGKTLITYCTIGYRSGIYADEHKNDGKIKNLFAASLGWAHAGFPFYKDGQETKKIHVYGVNWDLLPDGYEADF